MNNMFSTACRVVVTVVEHFLSFYGLLFTHRKQLFGSMLEFGLRIHEQIHKR